MILQGATTWIHCAHEPEHLPGQMHGHTWRLDVYQKINEPHWIPDLVNWQCKVREVARAMDHRVLKPGESLMEHIALYIGQPLGAAKVVVSRMVNDAPVEIIWTPDE